MQQDQLDGLMAFVTVAEEKGFSAAAVRMGVSASAVSQSVKTLERRLGAVLFNRTTRSVSLTEAGQRYYERVRPALELLTDASQDLVRESGQPSGVLRLNIPRAAYLIVLRPLLRRFLEAYPEITVEMRVESQLEDIVAQGFDAGIRFGQLVEKDMVAIRVGPPLHTHIIASPEYLQRHGVPRHPTELLEHECINFRFPSTGQIERWEFARGDESFHLLVKGRLIVNDATVLVRSALDGMGIANMISGYIEPLLERGRLVRLLEDWSPQLPHLHLYYPSRRVPAKLRALVDFLRAAEGKS